MRLTIALAVLGGCAAVEPCRTGNLDLWCWHDPEADGPVAPANAGCEPPIPSDHAVEESGWLVDTPGGANFSGLTHYFDADTLEHVSTVYWTDVNTYCGGFEYTYGRKIN